MRKILSILIAIIALASTAYAVEPPSSIVSVSELFKWSKENKRAIEFVGIIESKRGLALVAFSQKTKEGLYLTTYLQPSGKAEYYFFDHIFSEKADYGDGTFRYVQSIEYSEEHDVLMYMYLPTGILSHSLPLTEAFAKIEKGANKPIEEQPIQPPRD